MQPFDLGFWMGIILAVIPALEVYQGYGVFAAMGAYLVSMYLLGIILGFTLDALAEMKKRN